MLVFVGSRTTRERGARGAGLSAFEVDGTFTRWRLLQTVDLVNPSFLHADAASRRLYTVHGDLGDVSVLAVDGNRHLALLNRQPVQGRNPVHLESSSDGRYIVVASYATGSLSALPLLADGTLGAASSRLALQGSPGPHRTEQNGPHPHHLPRWPGTDLFIVPDKGLDRVHVVRLGPDGVLGLVGESVARSCAGPRHAAFDLAERRVWVANELDSTVTAYGFDVEAGTLHGQRTVGLLPDDFTGESRAAGIATARDTVYVSNRGHDSVTVLQVERATGEVVRRRWQPTLGSTPRFLCLTPDGSFLIVANEGSDMIVRWRVADDGSLEDITEGRIFRSIARSGRIGQSLSADAVNDIVHKRCRLAGLEGDYSAHSLRSGFVTAATRLGAPAAQIMAASGHRSVQSLLGYTQVTDAGQRRLAHDLLLTPSTPYPLMPGTSAPHRSSPPRSA